MLSFCVCSILQIFVFQLYRVVKAMRALKMDNEDSGRRFNYEREGENPHYDRYRSRRRRRRRRSANGALGQGGDSTSRSNSPFSASPDSVSRVPSGALGGILPTPSAPSRSPSPPPFSYERVDPLNPHSFQRRRENPFHSGSGFSSFSEQTFPSVDSFRRSASVASQRDTHRELFPGAYGRPPSSTSGGTTTTSSDSSELRHRPSRSRRRDRPMHPLANDDRFSSAGFSVSETGSSGAYPYHYGTAYRSMGRPSSNLNPSPGTL